MKQRDLFWRLLVVVMVMVVGAGLGSGYGALHDQLSYALSPDYFTRFKFIQFELPWAYQSPRLGAAWVGVLASWWLGALTGMVFGCMAILYTSLSRMLLPICGAMLLVLICMGLFLLLGLAHGYWRVDADTVHSYQAWLWSGVSDPVAFVRVGILHIYSYLGALTGLAAGVAYIGHGYRGDRA